MSVKVRQTIELSYTSPSVDHANANADAVAAYFKDSVLDESYCVITTEVTAVVSWDNLSL